MWEMRVFNLSFSEEDMVLGRNNCLACEILKLLFQMVLVAHA